MEYIKESIKLYFKPFKSKWIYIIAIPIAIFATYLEIIGVLKWVKIKDIKIQLLELGKFVLNVIKLNYPQLKQWDF